MVLISKGKIDGKPIIRAWESWNGIYWIATEEAWKQDSIIEGKTYKDDQIYFGFVTGPHIPEWGYFSSTEVSLLFPKVWELKTTAINWLIKET